MGQGFQTLFYFCRERSPSKRIQKLEKVLKYRKHFESFLSSVGDCYQKNVIQQCGNKLSNSF